MCCFSVTISLLLTAAFGVLLLLAALGHLDRFAMKSLPPLPANEYWGSGPAPKVQSDKVEKFEIAVPKETLAELQTKLRAFKFIEPLEESNFEYGFNGKFMQQVVRHWLEKYSWKEWERRLNSVPNYRTRIEGLSVHFVRAPASKKAKRVLPLLIVHGWPGSVLEFHKLIPLLVEPDANGVAFEVVAPSIPGYAWSEAPKRRGFNTAATARIFHKLMQRIGHSRYYTQGGDWGALVTQIMTRHFPDSVLGHHTNMPTMPSGLPSVFLQTILGAYLPGVLSPADSAKVYPFFDRMGQLLRETGYFHLQATRPDTVGHALQDSPVGLAAYILEKFCVWTWPEDRFQETCNLLGPKAHFRLDELLTNVMIYWTTGSVTSSMRYYKENIDVFNEMTAYQTSPTSVPHGVACFRNELSRTPERWVRVLHPNLLRYADFQVGGHFAALQLPDEMHKEIRAFVLLADEFHRQRAAKATTARGAEL